MSNFKNTPAPGEPENTSLKNSGETGCIDCLFWYRCKLGKIDCDLRLR